MGKNEYAFSEHEFKCGKDARSAWRYFRTTEGDQNASKTVPLRYGGSQPRAWWWTNPTMYTSTFVCLIFCLVGLIPITTAAESLVCPQPCTCSQPSQYAWKESMPSTLLPSVNCSNQGLDDFLTALLPLYNSSTNIENNTNNTSTYINQHHIHVLDVSGNNLEIVQLSDMVAGTDNTSWLGIDAINLSHNYISGFFMDGTCVLDNVFTLDLSFNQLENLDDLKWPLCRGLHFLQELNLSHNYINELENTSFSSLVRLTSLDLSFNQMQAISSTSFERLVSLQYLFLSANNLTEATDVFPYLPNLVQLDMSNNLLEYIAKETFSRLISLQILNLNNNRIASIDAGSFQGLSHFTELSLNQNLLTSLNEFVFQNATLQRLSLSSMAHLTNISHRAFSGLSHLAYLNMSNNQRLKFLQPDTLTPMTELQVVDLSHCGIQQLSFTTFRNPNLRKIYLTGLPLLCECMNAWIAQERSIENSTFSGLDQSRCIGAKNETLDVMIADFNCGPVYINNTSAKINIPLGSPLMLPCNQVSEELAVLTWTTPSGKKLYHHDFHPEALLHLLSPEDVHPDSPFHQKHYWHESRAYYPELSSEPDRIIILTDGSLYIDYLLRQDTGDYKCEVMNSHFNHSITVTLHLQYDISGRIKVIAFVMGFLCALGFFMLNTVYVVISWSARRLVNKRRREIILQMLENLNAYKSTQITRIHENYTHQLSRVRNQYHIQRDRLHNHYSGQVGKVKRGCSNQVEKVRENYNSKLTNLREYSSKQILQIRESANNQIGRIRDYGSLQLERVRETYKLQQRHVLKLLDTMNLDNCRSVVETECMRTESMMFDIDLLVADDDRIGSPISHESEYNTAVSSPNSCDRFTIDMEEDNDTSDFESRDMARCHYQRTFDRQMESSDADDEESCDQDIENEVNTSLSLPGGIHVDAKEVWNYSDDEDIIDNHILYTKIHGPGFDRHPSLRSNQKNYYPAVKQEPAAELAAQPSQTMTLNQHLSFEVSPANGSLDITTRGGANEENWSGTYVTPEASPIKTWSNRKAKEDNNVALEDIKLKTDQGKEQDESEL